MCQFAGFTIANASGDRRATMRAFSQLLEKVFAENYV